MTKDKLLSRIAELGGIRMPCGRNGNMELDGDMQCILCAELTGAWTFYVNGMGITQSERKTGMHGIVWECGVAAKLADLSIRVYYTLGFYHASALQLEHGLRQGAAILRTYDGVFGSLTKTGLNTLVVQATSLITSAASREDLICGMVAILPLLEQWCAAHDISLDLAVTQRLRCYRAATQALQAESEVRA